MTTPVVDVASLDTLDGSVVFADLRWYLTEPGRGPSEYAAGHIPGAIHIDLEHHLTAPNGPGRHPLASRETFAATMGRLGIGDDDLVVAYDDVGGAVAARLWWMLRDIGHDRVLVLDGGIQAWVATGHHLESGTVARPITTMTVGPSLTRQVDRHDVRTRLGSVLLLDARAAERYRGEVEPVDPVAGHIPTARNAPTTGNLDAEGRLLPPGVLRARFAALGADLSAETIVYCGSGVYACHNALAMTHAGLPEPILYPGSWSDWGTEGGEVATGEEPGHPG